MRHDSYGRGAMPSAVHVPAALSRTTFALLCIGKSVVFVLLLSLPLVIGCATINRFIFTPTKGLAATPASRSIPYQEVWFRSNDGVLLNGWLMRGNRDKPLVLLFHGVTGNLADNLDYIELLHRHEFPIFVFDYRGYGKSEGEPVDEDDLYRDARGALSYLQGGGWLRNRMIYFGQSLGSAVALQMAVESAPQGLVMEGSFTCLKDVIKHISPFGYYSVSWWGIDLPFDNLSKIARAPVPVLLIHGDHDPVAPVEMTMRLYQAATEPKMLHIVRGGGHCNAFAVHSSAYLAAWNSYLASLSSRAVTARQRR